ncbi:hypothetical protein evm_013909 [Chilo suppressalis]|nr:hypothetical protein evm_013909 [Chilo suppressalis]
MQRDPWDCVPHAIPAQRRPPHPAESTLAVRQEHEPLQQRGEAALMADASRRGARGGLASWARGHDLLRALLPALVQQAPRRDIRARQLRASAEGPTATAARRRIPPVSKRRRGGADLLRALLPALVNGTKEKNTYVRANSELALRALLRLPHERHIPSDLKPKNNKVFYRNRKLSASGAGQTYYGSNYPLFNSIKKRNVDVRALLQRPHDDAFPQECMELLEEGAPGEAWADGWPRRAARSHTEHCGATLRTSTTRCSPERHAIPTLNIFKSFQSKSEVYYIDR